VEYFTNEFPSISEHVQEELGFGRFAEDGCGGLLRYPKQDLVGNAAALDAIGRTMPRWYGQVYSE
jgi:hypothetical protein